MERAKDVQGGKYADVYTAPESTQAPDINVPSPGVGSLDNQRMGQYVEGKGGVDNRVRESMGRNPDPFQDTGFKPTLGTEDRTPLNQTRTGTRAS